MRRHAKALRAIFVTAVLFAFFGLGATAFADAPPTVTIDPPTEVEYQSAHVSGTVNPEGGPSTTYWHFEYSTNPSDPFSWSWSTASGEISGTAAEGTSPATVEGTMEYLSPGTEYAVRLVAENGEFTNRAETEAPYPTFTTLAVSPAGVTISPPGAITLTSARFEGDIDTGGNDPAFNVYWFFECTPSCPGLEGSLPGDGASHHISAEATGLTPGIEYQVTLYASNAGGISSAGPESFTTLTAPPHLEHVAAHVRYTEGELQAKINPNGLETTYHFEYGETAAYGKSTPVATLPAGGVSTKVSAPITGLSPSTTYHFRLVAGNADGEVDSGDREFATNTLAEAGDTCPNAAVRAQQKSAFLPDCRAYEMVSPPAKNLGDVARVMRASDDGEAVAFGSTAAPEGANGAHTIVLTVGRRNADGWSLESAETPGVARVPVGGPTAAPPVDFSPDFSRMLSGSLAPLVAGDYGVVYDLYEIAVGTGATTWLSEPQGVPFEGKGRSEYGSSSADMTRIYFSTRFASLLPGAPDGALYEWNAGSLRLVSKLPDGTPEAGRVAASQGTRSGYSEEPFGGEMAVPHRGAHAVSDDGSRVYWSSENGARLYLSADGRPTVALSASRRAGHEGEVPSAQFIAASHDGSVAYFASTGQLTDEATDAAEIYRYDVASDSLVSLTSDAVGGTGGRVRSAMASDDASHVYFRAEGALAPGAESGKPNLYVWSAGKTRYIGTADLTTRFVRVSNDGSYALFESEASLAGANNNGQKEVYVWDDAAEHLSCASCRVDGSASEAEATVGEGLFTAPFANAAGGMQRMRNLADDGTVFFDTKDQLVPVDVNHVFDVYEYAEGKVHLLSDGHSDSPSFLADNSDSGRDVFIMTRSRLVPADTDELYDVYDVRSGGGFLAPETSGSCSEDECQGAAAGPPGNPAIGTKSLRRGTRPRRPQPAIKLSRRPTASELQKLAHGRAVRLELTVNRPGRATAVGLTEVGGKNRKVILGSGRARHAGPLHLPIALSRRGLLALRREGRLRVGLHLRFSSARRSLTIVLRAPSGRGGGA